MNQSAQIAKHFREVFFGGNWTVSCLKEHLADVTWEHAVKKLDSFNTIATLVFHINYFVEAVSKVLDGEQLNANDKFSFSHPPIQSKEAWDKMLAKTWVDAEKFASQIEKLPENKLWETFVDEKYGIYYRNFFGIIEHTHYHLGQIVLIKKMIFAVEKN